MIREQKIDHLKSFAAVCERMAEEADCRAEAHNEAGQTGLALIHLDQGKGHREAAATYLEHALRLAMEEK